MANIIVINAKVEINGEFRSSEVQMHREVGRSFVNIHGPGPGTDLEIEMSRDVFTTETPNSLLLVLSYLPVGSSLYEFIPFIFGSRDDLNIFQQFVGEIHQLLTYVATEEGDEQYHEPDQPGLRGRGGEEGSEIRPIGLQGIIRGNQRGRPLRQRTAYLFPTRGPLLSHEWDEFFAGDRVGARLHFRHQDRIDGNNTPRYPFGELSTFYPSDAAPPGNNETDSESDLSMDMCEDERLNHF